MLYFSSFIYYTLNLKFEYEFARLLIIMKRIDKPQVSSDIAFLSSALCTRVIFPGKGLIALYIIMSD